MAWEQKISLEHAAQTVTEPRQSGWGRNSTLFYSRTGQWAEPRCVERHRDDLLWRDVDAGRVWSGLFWMKSVLYRAGCTRPVHISPPSLITLSVTISLAPSDHRCSRFSELADFQPGGSVFFFFSRYLVPLLIPLIHPHEILYVETIVMEHPDAAALWGGFRIVRWRNFTRCWTFFCWNRNIHHQVPVCSVFFICKNIKTKKNSHTLKSFVSLLRMWPCKLSACSLRGRLPPWWTQVPPTTFKPWGSQKKQTNKKKEHFHYCLPA